jgi:hypothetical protein
MDCILNRKNIYIFGGTILILNLLFLCLNLLASLVPPENIKLRVKENFAAGASIARSLDAFTECSLMIMGSFRGRYPLLNAVSPQLPLGKPGTDPFPCKVLHGYVIANETLDPDHEYYTRYWFGTRTINQTLVNFFSIDTVKQTYFYLNYLLLFLILIMSFKMSFRLGLVGLPVLVYTTFFSGLNFFGDNIGHALSAAWPTISVLLILTFLGKWQKNLNWLIVITTLIGGGAVYLDLLNGAILITVPLVTFYIFNSCLFIAKSSAKEAFLKAATAFGVLLASTVFTVISKLTVSSFFLGWGYVYSSFAQALQAKMQRSGNFTGSIDEFLAAFERGLPTLSYGSLENAYTLIYVSLIAWAAFIYLTLRRETYSLRGFFKNHLFLLNFGISLFVLSWFVFFKGHTVIHSWFIVRFVYLPLSLGWAGILQVKLCKI